MPEWRDVPGFEGFYQVSDEGAVKSLPRVIVRKNGSPQTVRGRLLRPGFTKAGYPLVSLLRDGVPKMVYVHHLVLEAFVEPRPEGLECRHRNGVEGDCRLSNLKWGSHAKNEGDKVDHGTSNLGARNGHAKLTPVAVREIRHRYGEGDAVEDIAGTYKVAKRTVYDILQGRTWTHVKGMD